ncbi:PREDICTED: complement factor H-like [Branchiostoma belcheri]|uniref:Complement factor H-like n=1 Tax=Branchiostoma belcheri TaxID=7741 RepID=A0A6P5A1E2_BRABE|nr:PREDICTED: complement factor H-like [Branchiostoma belcheri]
MLRCYDGTWTGTPLVCEENCGEPPMPSGTIRDGCDAPYLQGEVCNYQCQTGYIKDLGDDSLTCNNGAWEGEELFCKANCEEPSTPGNTVLNTCDPPAPPYYHGAECTLKCADGFTSVGGDDRLTCRGGEWILIGEEGEGVLVCEEQTTTPSPEPTTTPPQATTPPPTTIQTEDCEDPPMPDCTIVNGCIAPYTHGEVCDYQCDPTSTADGGDNRRICNDGNWDGVDLVCKKDCEDPPMPDCTTVNGCAAPYTHGEVCNYQCDDGSTEQGGDDTLTCINGNWDGEDLVCKKDCEDPPMPDCTTVAGCAAPYTHGEVCNYLCDAGSIADGGDFERTCNDGNWDGVDLVCKKDCEDPPMLDCTTIAGCAAPYTHGEVCNYRCDYGSTKQGGDDTLTCNNGNWIGVDLVCKSKANTVSDSMASSA